MQIGHACATTFYVEIDLRQDIAIECICPNVPSDGPLPRHGLDNN